MRNSLCGTPEIVGEIFDREKFLYNHPTNKEFNAAVKALNDKIDTNTNSIESISRRVSVLEKNGPLEIISLTATPDICEKGKSENIVLSWEIRGDYDYLSINGMTVTGREYTVRNVTADTEFVLTAVKQNERVTKKVSVKFINFVYYGVTSDETMSRSIVKALEYNKFTDDLNMDVEVEANDQYIVFAYPKRLGKVVFRAGVLEGGFKEPAVVSVDNHNTYYEDYYVYRSYQKLIGTPVITVKAI